MSISSRSSVYLALSLLAFALAKDVHAAATISLQAVARNGNLVTPTNHLQVAPNDTVAVEVKIFGWATPPFDPPVNTGLVGTYQVTLNGAIGAESGDCGLVLPLGWDAPVIKDLCPCTNPQFPTCNPTYGCIGPNHNPAQMASLSHTCTAANTDVNGGTCTANCCVNGLRSDYIFYGFASLPASDVSSLNVRFGGTINGPGGQDSRRCGGASPTAFQGLACTSNAQCGTGGSCDFNYFSYGGTLNLKVTADACGTFTFSLVDDINYTFIANNLAFPITVLPLLEALSLEVATPCCDDGLECTQDNCMDGFCQNSPLSAGTTCTDDGDACTADVCDGSGTCTHTTGGPCGACCSADLSCEDDVPATECHATDGYFFPSEECAEISCASVPTVSEWGLVVLTLLGCIFATCLFSRPAPDRRS